MAAVGDSLTVRVGAGSCFRGFETTNAVSDAPASAEAAAITAIVVLDMCGRAEENRKRLMDEARALKKTE